LCSDPAASGVRFISEPTLIDTGANAGGAGLYLRDPDGIVLELFQRPKVKVAVAAPDSAAGRAGQAEGAGQARRAGRAG